MSAGTYVPGVSRCNECKFELTNMVLCATTGNVGVGQRKAENCPNGCGPLAPVTWEQEARKCWGRMEEMFDEGHRVRKALEELVAVKDLKTKAEAVEFAGLASSFGEAWEAEFKRLRADYIKRQPEAWAAARAALSPLPEGSTPERTS
jgi:hypothetical protein